MWRPYLISTSMNQVSATPRVRWHRTSNRTISITKAVESSQYRCVANQSSLLTQKDLTEFKMEFSVGSVNPPYIITNCDSTFCLVIDAENNQMIEMLPWQRPKHWKEAQNQPYLDKRTWTWTICNSSILTLHDHKFLLDWFRTLLPIRWYYWCGILFVLYYICLFQKRSDINKLER